MHRGQPQACSCAKFIPSFNSSCAVCKKPRAVVGLGSTASGLPRLPPKQNSFSGPSYSSQAPSLQRNASYASPAAQTPLVQPGIRVHRPAPPPGPRSVASIDAKQLAGLLAGLNDTLAAMGKKPLSEKEQTSLVKGGLLDAVVSGKMGQSGASLASPRPSTITPAPGRPSLPSQRSPPQASVAKAVPPPRPSSTAPKQTPAIERAPEAKVTREIPSSGRSVRETAGELEKKSGESGGGKGLAPAKNNAVRALPQTPEGVEKSLKAGRSPRAARKGVRGSPSRFESDVKVRQLQEEVDKLKVTLERERTSRKTAEMGGGVRSRLLQEENAAKLEELSKQVEEWKQRHSKQHAKAKALAEAKRELLDKIRDIEVQLQAHESSEGTARKQVEELAALREQLQLAQKTVREQEQRSAVQKEELLEARALAEQHLAEQLRLRAVVDQTQTRCQKQMQHLQELLQAHMQQVDAKFKQEQELRQQAQRRCVELETASGAAGVAVPAAAGEVERLRAQIRQLGEEKKAAEGHAADAEEARREIAGRLVQVQVAFADKEEAYEREARQLRKGKASAELAHATVETECSALRNSGAGSTPLSPRSQGSMRAEQLERQVQKLEQERAKEEQDFERLMAELSRLRKQPDANAMVEAAQARHSQELARIRADFASQLAAAGGAAAAGVSTGAGVGIAALEEEKRRLELELSTARVAVGEVEVLRQELEEARAQAASEAAARKERQQARMQQLQEALRESEEARVRLEATKATLESTVDLLQLNSAAPADAALLQEAIQKERSRAREEVKSWKAQAEEAATALQAVEERLATLRADAAAGSRAAWEEELEQVQAKLAQELLEAREENALLSAEVEALRDALAEEEEEEGAYSAPGRPFTAPSAPAAFVPPPTPGALPPPPPPPPGPAPSTKLNIKKGPGRPKAPAPSRAPSGIGIDAIRGVKLKKATERPQAPRAASPPDLLKEIRQGVHLRKVDPSEQAQQQAEVPDDPTNILQVLAKVLIARRETLELNQDEEEDDWEP